MKPGNWLQSLNCAIEGILWAARTQRHLRWHFIAAIVVLLLALQLRLSAFEFIVLTLAITLVLFAEMVNTAIEVLVDLVSPDYHPLAGRAKDVAAGAVLLAAIGAVVLGYLVLAGELFPLLELAPRLGGGPPGGLGVVAVLVVTILVVLLKARFGRGTPLHGGMPSGHAAVAFSIAVSVTLSGAGGAISLLAVMLAAMVAHSRLLLEIHTLREVLAGVLLGGAVTGLMFLLFG